MLQKLLLLLLLPTVCLAQNEPVSHKTEYNAYHEIGITGKSALYGLHYNWQTQVSRKWYLGAGVEGLQSSLKEEGKVRRGKLITTAIRLSHVSAFEGFRLNPFVGAGVVLSQPTGTVLEGGLGIAAGRWQVAASYRLHQVGRQQPDAQNGFYIRFSRLLVRIATKPRFNFKKQVPETIERTPTNAVDCKEFK